MARLFERSRREGKAWRACCPVHKSKSLTLAIYADDDKCSVHCHAGCSSDDILASVGLTWRDTYYQPHHRLPRSEWLALQRVREAEETRSANTRIGDLVLRFCDKGYTLADRDRDVTVAVCAAALLTVKPERHRELLLRGAMERITAAEHCRERGMLPNVELAR